MSLIFHLAPVSERLTLERVRAQATYNYKARGFFDLPVIESTFHAPKCRPDSWLYVAAPTGSSLAALSPSDKLYVGSQTADRMFQGDGMGGNNFHHAQMRAGNGNDTLLNYLSAGHRVDIHRISALGLRQAVLGTEAFAPTGAAAGTADPARRLLVRAVRAPRGRQVMALEHGAGRRASTGVISDDWALIWICAGPVRLVT